MEILMMTITGLSEDDISHIKQAIENQYKDYLICADALLSGNINHENAETLIDIISNDLVRNGLDANDAPNDYGNRLEDIIDRLGEKDYEGHGGPKG